MKGEAINLGLIPVVDPIILFKYSSASSSSESSGARFRRESPSGALCFLASTWQIVFKSPVTLTKKNRTFGHLKIKEPPQTKPNHTGYNQFKPSMDSPRKYAFFDLIFKRNGPKPHALWPKQHPTTKPTSYDI
jgi:hypothetical protein